MSLRDIAPYYSCEVLPKPCQNSERSDFYCSNDSVVKDDSVFLLTLYPTTFPFWEDRNKTF